MIITCNNCNKKFEIDENLIPEKGRLLQCSSCNHQWHFKKEFIHEVKESTNDQAISVFDESSNITSTSKEKDDFTEIETNQNINNNKDYNDIVEINKFSQQNVSKKPKNNKNILSIIVVSTISFVALIILADTLQRPISKFFPGIEIMLYNLYESIKDIILFFKDLV
tara:strand:- start:738 stop:1238 length:501 start_codon:yes stop_codon:yes gene_type:complete